MERKNTQIINFLNDKILIKFATRAIEDCVCKFSDKKNS